MMGWGALVMGWGGTSVSSYVLLIKAKTSV